MIANFTTATELFDDGYEPCYIRYIQNVSNIAVKNNKELCALEKIRQILMNAVTVKEQVRFRKAHLRH